MSPTRRPHATSLHNTAGLSTKSVVVSVVVGIALIGVIYFAADKFYLKEARQLRGEIATHADRIGRYESVLPNHIAVRDALRERAADTIGRDRDRTEHRLRTALTKLAEREGLRGIVVSSASPSARGNPAARERTPLRRALSARTDFDTVSGRVSGGGSLEQTLDFLAAAESQPWLDRVDGFSISPSGRDRQVYEIAVDFTVLLMPDLAPQDTDTPLALADTPSGARTPAARLLARSPFIVPPPDATPEPAPPAPVMAERPPETPPPPPYHEWIVTGLILRPESDGGSEAWLRHGPSGNVKKLKTGDRVLEAQLVAVEPDRAVFRLGDEEFRVLLRRTLAERVAMGSVD